MPKLPRNIKPKILLRCLKSKGFIEIGEKGSHVRLKHKDGRWTQVAVHAKPIPRGTLRKILNQSKIDIRDLI
ncbi:MAG: YcfA-like protein [Candidatus Woesebacteria bacterium GW2011_GWA1_33_30]|uniref:YcfA-like protein n=1 Tax=Candidatus Woesebacteria bacterium GW2011_GWA2_33_28 TaxID=1618561 RepID=A0A0G0CT58_9BACT|nr:MAG: YcfA-like protein [Candidatus Woesebacteria bacterium GW2011_GWA2_33_28]KKP47261.1 MAG: YcfA-like protein [Candidatus Woesebacteria bacterium GW2011_GWA1_33_30]KKP48907.1 MAG: YcfA-like protein [Microgenomates group bacterium GW2011_GWC1_33_32]KKP51445.1 MAG: YcfA-like protein [Candidatus Woesebacteria bacterium GW2011_GWB1_33_38]